jgi:hypothetical protein
VLRTSSLLFLALVLFACNGKGGGDDTAPPESGSPDTLADVTEVTVTGEAPSFQFSVTLRSPDTGCEQYANWWEVVRQDGSLVYRRILGHSHVDEQPFTRSGGPVAIEPGDEVIVRAYMHPGGYGGAAMRGTQAGGFDVDASIDAGFAAALSTAEPQPTGCAF